MRSPRYQLNSSAFLSTLHNCRLSCRSTLIRLGHLKTKSKRFVHTLGSGSQGVHESVYRSCRSKRFLSKLVQAYTFGSRASSQRKTKVAAFLYSVASPSNFFAARASRRRETLCPRPLRPTSMAAWFPAAYPKSWRGVEGGLE